MVGCAGQSLFRDHSRDGKCGAAVGCGKRRAVDFTVKMQTVLTL